MCQSEGGGVSRLLSDCFLTGSCGSRAEFLSLLKNYNCFLKEQTQLHLSYAQVRPRRRHLIHVSMVTQSRRQTLASLNPPSGLREALRATRRSSPRRSFTSKRNLFLSLWRHQKQANAGCFGSSGGIWFRAQLLRTEPACDVPSVCPRRRMDRCWWRAS